MGESAHSIVVVQPSRTLRTLISQTLIRQGHPVEAFADGASALEFIRSEGATMTIIDAELGTMSGLDLAEQLNLERLTAPIPCILLISEQTATDPDRLAHAGISETLTKPFEQQQLLQRIRAQIPDMATPAMNTVNDPAPPSDDALKHWIQEHLKARVGDALEALVQRAVRETLLQMLETPDSAAGRRLLETIVAAVRAETKEVLEQEPVAVLRPALEGVVKPTVLKTVPELAEDMIREEIRRLTEEGDG